MSVKDFLATQEGRGAATQPADTAAPIEPWSPGPYRIASSDVLQITVTGLDVVGLPHSHTLRVAEDGTITLDPIGSVQAAGLTLEQLERELHGKYVPKFIRQTSVAASVVNYGLMPVIVLGEVRTPTTTELRHDRNTLLHAILAAGGPTSLASGRVTLLRAGQPNEPAGFDLNRPADLARAARAGSVSHSDVVIVERGSSDFVFVQGLVKTPGPLPMPTGTSMSVMQALAAAGGTLHDYEPREATLMRRKPDGEMIRVALDLHQLHRGEQVDLALAPGDILVVPHGADTRIEEWLAETLYFRAGVNGIFNPWTYYFFREDLDLRRDALSAQQTRDFFSNFARFGDTDFGAAPPAPPNP